MRIFTVGHSNREPGELISILASHGVELVVDVRRFPGSRRHPHFSRGSLEEALGEAGIGYLWLEGLGGRRSRREGSVHTAWEEPGFAAYADHLDSDEFGSAARTLLDEAATRRTAMMCAEARWVSCHRRLIADWLTARGHEVVHIADGRRTEPHRLPSFARVEDGRLVYDGGQQALPGL